MQSEIMGSTVYEDYIMRQIRNLMKTLLHIIGLREAGHPEAARQEIGEVYRQLFGEDGHLFLCIDSKTGAELLAHPEKMAVVADLFHEEAEIMRAGKQEDLQDMDRRALEYALEAFIAAPQSEENATRIKKLAKHVYREALDTRYQQVLEKL
jgi:hypothetical protein